MATKKTRKRQGGVWPVALGAVGIGIVAALLSAVYLKSKEAAIRAELEGDEVREIQVVVAARDLPAGSVVGPANFAARRVPEKFVHKDAVLPNQFEAYAGRSIITPIGSGNTLLKSFMDETFPVDFSDTIDKGRRAMTVSVDEINSVAGYIRPGNRIDLFVNVAYNLSGFDAAALSADVTELIPDSLRDMVPESLLDAARNGELPTELLSKTAPGDVIMPLLQNVRVLAAGKSPYRASLDKLRQPQQMRERTFSNLTLDVSPKQAAMLAVAVDKGELLAILRNRDDQSGADFSTVSARDLFKNAKQMAEAEAARQARVAVAGGLDGAGNLVDADGNRIMSRAELEAAGYTVNENGQIVDKDGNIIDAKDLVVGADGKVTTRQALAAAGLSVNANGQIVDKNGNVVAANELVRGPDGKLYTREELAAAGLSVNENGEIVDASGKVVAAGDLVTGADGKIYTRDQLARAGLTVDENGQIVDAATGEVVNPGELVTMPDGTVMTQAQLAAAGLKVNENGMIVDARTGEVLSEQDLVERAQMAAAGLAYNENGELIDTRTGKVLSAEEAKQRLAMAAAGLAVNENGEVIDLKTGKVLSQAEVASRLSVDGIGGRDASAQAIDIIVGGASKDGVAKVEELPITE